MTPLALTTDQLSAVMRAAEDVPVGWRGRFLESIADRLLGNDSIADSDVAAAITAVLPRFAFTPPNAA